MLDLLHFRNVILDIHVGFGGFGFRAIYLYGIGGRLWATFRCFKGKRGRNMGATRGV